MNVLNERRDDISRPAHLESSVLSTYKNLTGGPRTGGRRHALSREVCWRGVDCVMTQ
ncbi:hypothetical protein RESH_04708 [Rhodopirellula europaea SH398]|uniref:Uncharacterized protein n=1 Tax=Rhodopirellula europaea SH398 TaxID=1263868 RepID=M5SAN8_9BACT|nr:hypothetical protein RESH_04708 [Rhodopirellula europaea SH398]